MPCFISASIVSADLGCLGEELARLEAAGVDRVHVDLEDGVFVPNLTFGFPVLRAVRRLTRLPVEVHLMVADPERYVSDLAGLADMVAVHFEACAYPLRTLHLIRRAGAQAVLAFNPRTGLGDAVYLADKLDGILLMSAEPDRAGEKFLAATLKKVRQARRTFGEAVAVTVDGGVGPEEAGLLRAAGVAGLVVGRALFSAQHLPETVRVLGGRR